MPWRNKIDLQQGFSSYEEKFKHVETEILPNIVIQLIVEYLGD